MKHLTSNITKLYAFSFLQMTLFPMAIITLFWKDHIRNTQGRGGRAGLCPLSGAHERLCPGG